MNIIKLITSGMLGKKRTLIDKWGKTQRANLVALWGLNGNANDLSGNGFHGTPSANVTWGTGILPGLNAAVFAGDAYINCFSAALAAAIDMKEMTIASWQKVSAAGDWADAATRTILYPYTDGTNKCGTYKSSTANRLSMYYIDKTNNTTMSPTGWFFTAIAVSRSLSLCDLWVDTTKTAKGLPAEWAGALTAMLLGASSTVPAQPYKGSIGPVGLWNTKLSDAQLTALQTLTPPF